MRFINDDTIPASIVSKTAQLLVQSGRSVVAGSGIVLATKDAAKGEYDGFFPPAAVVDETPLIVQATIVAEHPTSGDEITLVEEVKVTPTRA